jgi:signal transduction histidine kinase
MALLRSRKTNDDGMGLKNKLLMIQTLVIGLPFLIVVYSIYSTGRIQLNISQMLIIALTLVLILAGLMVLRQIFDKFLAVTNIINKKEGSDQLLIEMQKDTTELHDISVSFSTLMKNFEESTEELKRRVFELFAIKELNEIASKSLDFRELLNALLEKAMAVTTSEIGSVFMVDSKKERFRVVASKGLQSVPREGSYINFDKSSVRQVVSSKKPLLVQNLDIDPRTLNTNDPQYKPPSFLCMPIFARKQLIAVLILSTWRDKQVSDSTDEQILSIMIGEIGFALENALLHSKIERHAKRLQNRTLELTNANSQLQQEITERERAEKALKKAHDELETRVQERTAELAKANKEMQLEITERIRTEEKLKIAKETAEAANVAKSQFLANMSHELRTPLNSIIGFSENMEKGGYGALNEKQSKKVNNILLSGRHLLNLINEILDISVAESGHQKLELSQFDISSLLENTLNIVKTFADKKDVDLSLEIEQGLSTITADQVKFKQILLNLLSNSIKFSPEGKEVKLSARTVDPQDGEKQPTIEISVTDYGVGIKPEDQKRIFEAFVQADSSLGRQFEGTGLGLALTKKFVELHGGQIWVESEGEGQGSIFTFTIPA